MRPSRRLVLSAAAMGLALVASGCTYLSPIQTHDFYQAADGENANISLDGHLYAGVRNAIVVLNEDGSAIFSASVVNYSEEDATVDLEAVKDGSPLFSASIDVPAGGVVRIGSGEGEQSVPVSAADILPGVILDLDVTAGGQVTTVSLPTIETNIAHYGEAPAKG